MAQIVMCLREEDVEGAEEEGFIGKGLKPTEDRFLRLHDMERFVQAAERAELDGDEDEDMSGGEPIAPVMELPTLGFKSAREPCS